MKNCYLDVETTGLHAKKNHIWQIAAIMDIDGKEVDRINLKMQPHSLEGVTDQDYALKMNGLTVEQLKAFIPSYQQFGIFLNWLNRHVDQYDKNDKLQFFAYNAQFDYKFVDAWFKWNNNQWFGSYFDRRVMDVMIIAKNHFRFQDGKPRNYKLETVGRFFGLIGPDADLHDAMYDIELTRKIDYFIQELNGQTEI